MDLGAKFKPKSIQVEAVVIKADGTVINLGVIDTYHRNPFVRWWLKFKTAYRVRQREREQAQAQQQGNNEQ